MIRKKIKVYLADDHNIVRRGMQRLLNSFDNIELVREAGNGKELLTLIEQEEPDAVILDVEMPVMGGIETAKIIAAKYPRIKILVLTMHTEEIFIHKLMDIGVHGFLSKSAEPEEVEKALHSIIEKDFYKNLIVQQALAKNIHMTSEETYSRLTTREIEILLLICQENSPGEISERLKISEKTFFNHRANILEKTKARSNVGLLRFAIQKGYFSWETQNVAKV
ncbi:DNA-binding response regulator [Cytophagales bacterium WSM2-2]|nr:DNA-binding response regulator [Cytophagales bacterium WSM2-2]